MRTRRLPPPLSLASACLALAAPALLATSALAAGTQDPEANIAGKAPVIHLEQVAVLLRDGKPVVEGNYRYMLANCNEGDIPVKPLPEKIAKKLGRTFFHVWYDGRRLSVRTDSWDYAVAKDKLCQFEPVHEAELSIDRPGELFHAKLTEGTATRQPSDGVVRHPLRKESDADKAMEAQVKAMLKKQGMGDLMDSRESEAEVAGQPCHRRESDLTGSSCAWSGGTQWGFAPEPFTPDAMAEDISLAIPYDAVLLSAEPADGDGIEWQTESMTLGGTVDDAAFSEPQGLTVKTLD